MNSIQKSAANVTVAVMLLSLGGCVVIGAGIGAVAGAGTSVGVVGGAVIGGVVGYGVSK
jgi:hypothetical protein